MALRCSKCNQHSGEDWSQCQGECPISFSPYFEPMIVSINVEGAQLSAGKISKALKSIKGRSFTSADLEAFFTELNAFNPMRSADRIIQRLRKAEKIQYISKRWHWVMD
jgi:hypothetical protein